MIGLFDPIKEIASKIKEAILMFSLGKDSIVCYDLMIQNGMKIQPIILLFSLNLLYKQKTIKWYENKYGNKIDCYLLPEAIRCLKNGTYTHQKIDIKKVSYADQEKSFRKKYDISFLAKGWKRTDTISRAIAIKNDSFLGIDQKNKILYPVCEFNDGQIMKYIKQKNLLLPPEYSFGYRNMDVPEKKALIFLKNNFKSDYDTLLSEYPYLEAELYVGN